MRSFALAGLLLFAAVPVHADTVFNVALSNITFNCHTDGEVVNASFNWDVASGTASDIFVSSSPLVFTSVGTSQVLQHEINGVTYIKSMGLGQDAYGDTLSIHNEFTDEIPAVPGTYDAAQRIGQVFFSCGSDCAQTVGYGGWWLGTGGTITVTAVPEPASISLLLFGLCSAFPILRKVRRTSN